MGKFGLGMSQVEKTDVFLIPNPGPTRQDPQETGSSPASRHGAFSFRLLVFH